MMRFGEGVDILCQFQQRKPMFLLSLRGCGGVFRRRRKRQKSKRNGIGTPKRHTTGKRERTKADLKKEDARWTRVSSSRRRFARQSSLNPRTTWRFSSRSRFGRKWLLVVFQRQENNHGRSARCFLTTCKTMRKSVSLYAAFFRYPPLKKKKNAERNTIYTKTRVKGGVKNNLL